MSEDTSPILLPKPIGFDLRDKRSDKSGKGSDWTVADTLYSAQQHCITTKADTVMVIWREFDAEGNSCTRFAFSGQPADGPSLLLNAVGKFMGWYRG